MPYAVSSLFPSTATISCCSKGFLEAFFCFTVTTLSIPLLGHKVGWVRGSAVALGFVGVVLVMRPGGDAFNMFALLPVAAAFFYALTSLSARYFDKDVSTALISIYGSVGAMTAAFVLLLYKGNPILIDNPGDWLFFILMETQPRGTELNTKSIESLSSSFETKTRRAAARGSKPVLGQL